MVQSIAISEQITLKFLRERFNLQWTEDSQFFAEWMTQLPELHESDQTFLDRVRSRYFYQLDEGTLVEGGVKMMMVAPLLDIAGFYDPPFRARFESPLTIEVETSNEVLQGRIDALVVQDQFWVWVLEAKRTTFSLSLGIPQALGYMLGNPNPQQPTFGLLTSGEDFMFIKLLLQPNPVYGLSRKLSILNDSDLAHVLQVMRRIGSTIAR